jgi:hypothetical protein
MVLEDSKSRLMQFVKDISIPRIVGSEGEKKIQTYLKKYIEAEGYKVQTQAFQASLFRINTLQQISNLAAALLFVVSAILFNIHPLLFLIPLGVILINIYLVSTGSPEMSQPPNVPKWVKCWDTENIISQSPRQEGNVEIIFMGHYDSKSSKLDGFWRLFMYFLLLIGAVFFLLVGLSGIIIYFIWPSIIPLFGRLIWIFAGIGALGGFVLTFNVVGNISPGAADNATAVAILMELMHYFKENPLKGANLTFLFTSAEEIGLTGAVKYSQQLKDNPIFSKENTFVINWDLAGLSGPVLVNTGVGIPKKLTSPTMSQFIDRIGEEQKIPVQQLYLPVGGWTDALPFSYYGYEAITISGKSIMIHSTKDAPNIIDHENLANSYQMGIELAKKVVEFKKGK